MAQEKQVMQITIKIFFFLVAESNSLDLFPFHGWFLAINIYRSPLN